MKDKQKGLSECHLSIPMESGTLDKRRESPGSSPRITATNTRTTAQRGKAAGRLSRRCTRVWRAAHQYSPAWPPRGRGPDTPVNPQTPSSRILRCTSACHLSSAIRSDTLSFLCLESYCICSFFPCLYSRPYSSQLITYCLFVYYDHRCSLYDAFSFSLPRAHGLLSGTTLKRLACFAKRLTIALPYAPHLC